jgi:hypothetical protein
VKTYPKVDETSGKALGFEIEVAYASLRSVARVLSGVDGVIDIRRRRPFSTWDEIHIRFRYQGAECVVWEPFGDNSRYWIGQEDSPSPVHLGDLETAFKNYNPPLLRRLIGDILSLRFLKKLFALDQE